MLGLSGSIVLCEEPMCDLRAFNRGKTVSLHCAIYPSHHTLVEFFAIRSFPTTALFAGRAFAALAPQRLAQATSLRGSRQICVPQIFRQSLKAASAASGSLSFLIRNAAILPFAARCHDERRTSIDFVSEQLCWVDVAVAVAHL